MKRERSGSLVKKVKRRKRGGKRRRNKKLGDSHLVAVPSSFACHICTKNHWTVDCPRLRHAPNEFPLMDRKRGCWKCAQRGHSSPQCTVKKYRCVDCGGLHDTRDCEFDHRSEEWHEFFDTKTQHVFYCNSETKEVRWTPPPHRLDVVLWFCAGCKILLPATIPECVKCHAPRPQSKLSSSMSPQSSPSVTSSSSLDSDGESGEEDGDEESCSLPEV
uniref:WW domain-containing protein n=1 Tax=Trypanosoma congolense (strain IL3000) TaxID=1068625 RepID=G0UKX4_TRYCI|nr:conserved hypothetical protein [Trypanosoma congolense IL3000]